MKHSTKILSIAFLLCATTVQAQQTVEVTVSSFAGLERAIDDANKRPADTLTSINVVGRIDWPAGHDPAFIVRSSVNITGGIFSQGDLGGGVHLFIVESSGNLSVDSAEFVDISWGGAGPTIFWNDG